MKFLVYFFILFNIISCSQKERACETKLKKALQITSRHYSDINSPSLDSALNLINESLICDTLRKSKVEWKLRILITLQRFTEAAQFTDSLKEDDFRFGYQKELMRKDILARQFNLINDSSKRDSIYLDMTLYLKRHINSHDLNSKEFEEAFTDLYSIKQNFLDTIILRKEIDSLKKVYPDKERFFSFFSF